MSPTPYLGEAAILYVLTRPTAEGFVVKTGGKTPTVVVIIIALQLVVGLASVGRCIFSLRRWLRNRMTMVVLMPRVQFRVWLGLLLTALIVFLLGKTIIALILLLLAQFFPRYRNAKLPMQTASE